MNSMIIKTATIGFRTHDSWSQGEIISAQRPRNGTRILGGRYYIIIQKLGVFMPRHPK